MDNFKFVVARFFLKASVYKPAPQKPHNTEEENDNAASSGDAPDEANPISQGPIEETEQPKDDVHTEETKPPEDEETCSDKGSEEAPDRSEPEHNAGHDANGAGRNSGAARGFQLFCRRVFHQIAAKAKMFVDKVRDSVFNAVKLIKEKGVMGAAKDLKDWIQQHPWEAALVVLPLVATASAALALLIIGFGPGGVAAGSAAAAMQAGIGNVVAHSLFATCTSAMMGGYGAPLIFGGTWILATAATVAAKYGWTRWNSRNDRRLVRNPGAPSNDILNSFDKAVDHAILGAAMAIAFVVYYVKSWRQSREDLETD